MPPQHTTPLRQLLAGKIQTINEKGDTSAIHKLPIFGRFELSETGLADDQQADRRVHGGPEKALHHYPFEHYALWQADDPQLTPYLQQVGAFGENISTDGLTEDNVYIGDIYQLGSTLLQVSQARQPCWKLAYRFNQRDMPLRLQKTGRTGWYYRVLQTGHISDQDSLILQQRPQPGWPLSRLIRALFDKSLESELLQQIIDLRELSTSWRSLASKRLESRQVENWDKRLYRHP